MIFWAKYNTQTTFSFPMVKRAVVDLAVSADWTPAAADSAISKDQAAFADTTNTVAAVGGSPTRTATGWKITLTATELSAAQIDLQIVDAATKAVEDQFITIYTYGNASAKVVNDWSDAVRMGLTALPNAAAAASGGLIINGSNAGTVTIGDGLVVNRSSANSDAVSFAASGTGHGLKVRSGTGATGNGLDVASSSTNGHAVNLAGAGTGDGLKTAGGTTGHGIDAIGGSAAAAGDGIKGSVLGTGVPIRGNLTGDITGNLSGSVGSVTGAVGSVTGAVGSVTGLTAATVHADLDDIQARLPAALVSGRMDSSVGAMAASVLTAAAINADAITAAKIADGAIDAATFAAGAINAAAIAADAITDAKVAADVTIASVTGAVGSVTGAVGSVTGAVGSVTAAVTVGTNNDKSGYSLTQTFPANFSTTVISAAGIVDVNVKKIDDVTILGDGSATPFKV